MRRWFGTDAQENMMVYDLGTQATLDYDTSMELLLLYSDHPRACEMYTHLSRLYR